MPSVVRFGLETESGCVSLGEIAGRSATVGRFARRIARRNRYADAGKRVA